MSRIGKKPIAVPEDTKVKIEGQVVAVKGPKGELSCEISPSISVVFADKNLQLTRKNESNEAKSLHGLSRALLANMVKGVHEGYTRELDIQGVGYRAEAHGQGLKLSLGFSHPIEYKLPLGVKAVVNKATNIVLSGVDKRLLGATAAEIRSFRAPEPYKGKGVRYVGEHVRRKEGKAKGKK